MQKDKESIRKGKKSKKVENTRKKNSSKEKLQESKISIKKELKERTEAVKLWVQKHRQYRVCLSHFLSPLQ